MKVSRRLAIFFLGLSSVSLPACQRSHADEKEQHHEAQNKILTTSPLRKDVVITQQYVCQIRSQKNTEIRALQEGYLEAIPVKEGQAVKEGQVLFKVLPNLYKARLDAEQAELDLAQFERNNTQRLYEKSFVSMQEVNLYDAKLNKAKAKLALAQAELKFTTVTAPYDGIIDRLQQMQGSLVKKEDLLTTLSDNSVMWVYFNVPEARYFEYKALEGHNPDPSRLHLVDSRVELALANGSTFNQDPGNVVTVEGKFNNETGNIPFRADFPNPDRLLRHGQTGTIRIHRTTRNALVIPQRATFELLDKVYVYVVGADHVAHRREIAIAYEQEDIFVLKGGLSEQDKIVLEGVSQIRDGQKLEDLEFRPPATVLKNQKNDAQ